MTPLQMSRYVRKINYINRTVAWYRANLIRDPGNAKTIRAMLLVKRKLYLDTLRPLR